MLEHNNPQNPLFPLKAIFHCRCRLSQQFASIPVSKPQYHQDGFLLNRKTRALLTVLQLVGKNSLIPFLKKSLAPQVSGQAILEMLRDCGVRCLESAEDVMSIIDWLVFTAYMLGLNKRLPLLERLLSFADAYDEQVEQMRDASYSVEGYLLVATFTLKAIKILFTVFTESYHKKSPKPPETPPNMHKERVTQSMCKICCGYAKKRSSTACGHVFCWSCIIQALESKPECPVCCVPCQPRSVIQLRNY